MRTGEPEPEQDTTLARGVNLDRSSTRPLRGVTAQKHSTANNRTRTRDNRRNPVYSFFFSSPVTCEARVCSPYPTVSTPAKTILYNNSRIDQDEDNPPPQHQAKACALTLKQLLRRRSPSRNRDWTWPASGVCFTARLLRRRCPAQHDHGVQRHTRANKTVL